MGENPQTVNASRVATWRVACLALVIVGGLLSVYLAWAQHRISMPVVALDDAWPRPFPYPDPWLKGLHDWYDARYPVPPGFLKLRGEVPRVQWTVAAALTASVVLTLAGAFLLASPAWKRRLRVRLANQMGNSRGC